MRKYEGLDSNGRTFQFRDKTDDNAISFAKQMHFKSLIRVGSFTKPIYGPTLLEYKQEGY